MKKTIVVFGLFILALLSLFQLSKYSVVSGDMKIENAIAIVAIIFFFIGVYIHKKSFSKIEKEPEDIDITKIKDLDITKREYEVLKFISEGLSNKEIGDKLFVSESTVKTHVSNILVKLNAKRRTQAVKIAKQYQII
ncbi:helix-turn-helix transcriptional regulator [Hanstruepera neustonica]|uniref:Helix-turn-helix transcriptional regulator n=1 Tax=Hanstruepera neustonica TaxID=1445657 RepID=A0A2K1E2T2_9FLAO|nr:response regulator transcription factor [Hanstruepera neustonica]PNQ74589.1 helix-turn-helix transcriptional regulator [Hanstruepera neustonica]